MYSYNAEILRVINGFTILARIDLGFNTSTQQILQLSDIVIMNSAKGLICSEMVNRLLERSSEAKVWTFRDDRDGSYIADLYLTFEYDNDECFVKSPNDESTYDVAKFIPSGATQLNVNKFLLANGFAKAIGE